MVTAFSLDSMHTIDGGSAKDFLERLIVPATKVGGVLSTKGRDIVDERFRQIRTTWPTETARYLRFVHIYLPFSVSTLP